jgi:hypothetical protein
VYTAPVEETNRQNRARNVVAVSWSTDTIAGSSGVTVTESGTTPAGCGTVQ